MSDGNKFYATINNEEVQIATVVTKDKTDYVYSNDGELVATIYNNDYKLCMALQKLEKEITKSR